MADIRQRSNGSKTRNENKGIGCLIAAIILLTLIVAVALSFVFNIGGLKDKVVAVVNPDMSKAIDKASEKSAVEKEWELIDIEKSKLNLLRKELDALKQELNIREEKLQEREEALTLKEEEARQLMEELSAQFNDIKELAEIYEKMDSEQAAAILSEMKDTTTAAVVLKNIKKEKSAEILGLMDSKKAVDILSKMYPH